MIDQNYHRVAKNQKQKQNWFVSSLSTCFPMSVCVQYMDYVLGNADINKVDVQKYLLTQDFFPFRV